jgi:hypothetical protein
MKDLLKNKKGGITKLLLPMPLRQTAQGERAARQQCHRYLQFVKAGLVKLCVKLNLHKKFSLHFISQKPFVQI